jgi:hypothetical protein
VGDLGCCHLSVQFLKVELWEWVAFMGLSVESKNYHKLTSGLKREKSQQADSSWSIV